MGASSLVTLTKSFAGRRRRPRAPDHALGWSRTRGVLAALRVWLALAVLVVLMPFFRWGIYREGPFDEK